MKRINNIYNNKKKQKIIHKNTSNICITFTKKIKKVNKKWWLKYCFLFRFTKNLQWYFLNSLPKASIKVTQDITLIFLSFNMSWIFQIHFIWILYFIEFLLHMNKVVTGHTNLFFVLATLQKQDRPHLKLGWNIQTMETDIYQESMKTVITDIKKPCGKKGRHGKLL